MRIIRTPQMCLTLPEGPRALLLQLAHPKVAAGVDEHSDFRDTALSRLAATLHLVTMVVYGSPSESEGAVNAMHRRHKVVKGFNDEAGAYGSYQPFPSKSTLFIQHFLKN